MTKPAAWVQFAVNKNSWWQKSSSFEISNLSKTMNEIGDFEIEEPWTIWKLICVASYQKSESGTNCWLTGPVKSLAVSANERKPENIL